MKVLLTALSAKAIHKTLAPWCLKAYCDMHVPNCEILVQEHTVNDHLHDIVKEIYLSAPDVVGFSLYIWNIEHTVKVATILRKYLPHCIIVFGGPEVSFETDTDAYPMADYIIQGAGEQALASLLTQLHTGAKISERMLASPIAVALNDLPDPYTEAYVKSFAMGRMQKIAHQLVYFESSRGCPFSCTYCLSSRFHGVDELSLELVFKRLDALCAAGAKCIKFVDRTFNANKKRAQAILQYILAKETTCTFHFEVAADLFDETLLALIAQMPKERVQFEIGIQSINGQTLAEIDRVMDIKRVLDTVKTLVSYGNCHIHVDLIAGLPFETLDSFSKGIDACILAKPQMLQLGFLKLLKGTKIREQRDDYGYVFSDFAPYEVLCSNSMNFDEMLKLAEIEAVVDKFYNSGVYTHCIDYLLTHVFRRPYDLFSALADFCRGGNPKLSQKHAYTLLYDFLCEHTSAQWAAHVVKLDCLTYYAKPVLPDEIAIHRDKKAEVEFKKSRQPHYQNVRIEYFPLDERTRVFIYDEACAITRAHKVLEQ